MPHHRSHSRRSIAVVGAGRAGLVSAVGLARLGHDIELAELSAVARKQVHRGGREAERASARTGMSDRIPAD